jgi:PilZ domain
MRESMEWAMHRTPVGGIVRYARKFYELLGNRRKFDRVLTSGTVFLLCKGSVIDTTHVCSCVDISPRGIGIECPERLAVGAYVQLQSVDQGTLRLARVRHILERDGKYRMGLEFVAKAEWAN